jgi:hypothetical protein
MFIGFARTLVVGLVLIVACAAGPARAEWRKAETEHFIVYGDASERDIRAVAQRIQRFDALLRTYYPIENDYQAPKLEIYLARGQRDMNRVYPGIGGSVAGFYSSNSGRIYAVVNTTVVTDDVVLFHEYAHHFMFQMGANAYPSWFVEGFAEYYATAEVSPGRIQFGRHHPGRMLALNQGANSWARMEDVLKWRYSPSGRYPAYLYYAQAWGMTHYFMSTPERTQVLRQYLSAVIRGEDSVEAMRAATGRTSEELQNDVRLYLSGSINVWSPQITLPVPEVTVTTLTRAEADMVWLDIRLDNINVIEAPVEEDGRTRKSERQKAREAQERAEERVRLIRDAHAAAARHPGDRMGILVAARAHRLSFDPAAALTALEPLIGERSTDADALRVAAWALLDQAGKESDPESALPLKRRASAFLARSMDAAPLDFRTYLGLNEVRRGMEAYPTDNDLATLFAAVGLAPQAFEGRMRLGEALMSRGRNDDAVRVLLPVSNSPHRSRYTRRAREMVTAARQAMGETVEMFDAPPDESSAEGESDEAG